MAETFSTTELLSSAREQGRIPDSDPNATDAKLLAIGNRQLVARFVPMVRRARAEWYQTYFDHAVVAGTQAYRIPSRAAGNSVRAVVLVYTSGQQQELSPVPETDRHLYPPSRGLPCVYTISDDEVVLLPTPATALGTLRIYYERRPSTLVDTTYAAVITNPISSDGPPTYQCAITSIGANLGLAIGSFVDVQDTKSPFSLRVQNALCTDATTPIEFTTLFSTLVLGQGKPLNILGGLTYWLTIAENTVIPPIPAELHTSLALAIACEWLLPIDPSFSGVLSQRLEQYLADAMPMLATRQQGRKQKLKSTSSMLRRGSTRRGWLSDWHS